METGIYCRVSTEEQAQTGFSIPEQKERLTNYSIAKGWVITDFYIET
jgi:site-specific DNA recombinase